MTSPPRPPSPPSGPPLGTNFSRRKLTHPRPPLPACAKTLIRSTNTAREPAIRRALCHPERSEGPLKLLPRHASKKRCEEMRDPSPSAAAQDDTRLLTHCGWYFAHTASSRAERRPLPVVARSDIQESARPNARFFTVEFGCCLSCKSFLSLAHASTNHERSPTGPTHQM